MSAASPAEGIAIIGMSGRFPGACNVEEFWRNLAAGVRSLTRVSDEVLALAEIDAATLSHPRYVRDGYFLDDVDKFDAAFFGFSPKEAQFMDPQHRLFLECAWEALENAGYGARAPELRTGIWAGASLSTYMQSNLLPILDMTRRPTEYLLALIGNDKDYLATRTSYKLNLKGPSIGVQTACSTSLVAVSLASQSLLDLQCDLALAGGVTVKHGGRGQVGYISEEGSILSPDGHCRVFDARAQGTVFGSGAGVVVLRRLEDALASRDPIRAVIRESAVNNDGALKVGYTAPSIDGQAEAIAIAQAMAGVPAETITYVETHGTGTPLGDAIEITALSQVFRARTRKKGFCAVGSVKSNVGHLESAAGVTSLIKTVLALEHKQIPPSLNFQQPNPQIDFTDSPFFVNTELREWLTDGFPRRAGVSSFGIGGTNAHAILEEAPEFPPLPAPARPWHLLALSAKSEAALSELASRYRDFLTPEHEIADVCFTANAGRSHFSHRLAIAARSAAELGERLAAAASGAEADGVSRGQAEGTSPLPVVFLFTGQGAQHAGMGRELYETQPGFRRTLDRCAEILRPYLDRDLIEILQDPAGPDGDDGPLARTVYLQPALFALEYALAELWRSWGIEPAALLGHSLGEYVAACLAGVFSLEDGLKLVAARARLMQALPAGGEMAAVFAGEARVAEALASQAGEVSIASLNGPEHTVISGPSARVREVSAGLEAAGVRVRPLAVSHAFHSPLVEPMLEDFQVVAREVAWAPPRLRLLSNLGGGWAGEEVATPEYWVRQVRQPVRFAAGMAALAAAGHEVFLEIGPRPTLLAMARACLPEGRGVFLPSLRPGRGDWPQILSSLAQLYVRGAAVDWAGFDRDEPRRRLPLPTYPFQRRSYWVQPPRAGRPARVEEGERGHPLLGRRMDLAAAREVRFESRVAAKEPAFLDHHRIFGAPVLPAAAYVELMLAAGAAVLAVPPCALTGLEIRQTLTLPADGEVRLQTVLERAADGTWSCAVHGSRPAAEGGDGWVAHASGTLRPAGDEGPAAADLGALASRMPEEIPTQLCYRGFAELGYDYGPGFRALERIRRRDGEALAEIRLPEALLLEADEYLLHPVLLDAALQTAALAWPAESERATYLPVGAGRLVFARRPGLRVWCHARVRGAAEGAEPPSAEVALYDESGEAIVRLEEIAVRRVRGEALQSGPQPAQDGWLYQPVWRLQTRPAPPPVEREPGTWLLFAGGDGLGGALAGELRRRGQRAVVVSPGGSFAAVGEDRYLLDPARPADFARLLRESLGAGLPACRGVVHLWSLAESSGEPLEALRQAQRLGCGSVLHMVQALAAMPGPPRRLWLVTRGAQPADPEPVPLAIAQAPLWGLGRVIAAERPELAPVLIDLDPIGAADEAERLLDEMLAPGAEPQIALRQDRRYAARLVRLPPHAGGRLPVPDAESFRLRASPHGILEEMAWEPVPRRPPGPGEVEIAVEAGGLNFRDVLHALGLLGAAGGVDVPLGFECAGTVIAVGDGVEGLAAGDAVVALAPGSLARRVTVSAGMVVPIPPGMSGEEAATLPVTFLTAAWGLHRLAGLRAGERVLIHAAAGGVGLAAVQLARRAGAEVLATASRGKRDFLRSLGLRHVMDSRSVELAQVMEATGGRGVEVVLNSLSGEFIPKSLEVLAPGGRFVEIGKQGIWSRERVLALRPDVSYFPFDIGEEAARDPDRVSVLLRELVDDIGKGSLEPLPREVFAAGEAAAAFRHMAQGRHVGKVVISMAGGEAGPAGTAGVRGDASYLITGGLGALGLLVARWLAAQGALRLVLAGRHKPDRPARKAIREIEAAGARVEVVEADIADPGAAARLLAAATASDRPLRGIVHAAGVLDDGVLGEQSWERFRTVLAPKVDGTWNLDVASEGLELDFFVCFSSVSSLLGAPGQGNYAAANAFLDAWAHHRRAQGLPGLAVNWGPWAEAGMASELSQRERRRLTALGWTGLPTEKATAVLGELLLARDLPQVAVAAVDWEKLAQYVPVTPPLLAELTAAAGGPPDLLRRLEEAPVGERRAYLMAFLRSEVARALGLDPSEPLDSRQGFFDLGMDSLLSVELSNRLRAGLGCALPSTVAFDYPNLEALANHLTSGVLPLDFGTVASGGREQSEESALAAIREEVAGLSDEEAEARLLQELEALDLSGEA